MLNFRSIVYSHSSSNPENLAKIGPVDFEIFGLTKIVWKKNQKQQQNSSPPCTAAESEAN